MYSCHSIKLAYSFLIFIQLELGLSWSHKMGESCFGTICNTVKITHIFHFVRTHL